MDSLSVWNLVSGVECEQSGFITASHNNQLSGVEWSIACFDSESCKKTWGCSDRKARNFQQKGGKNIPFLDENISYLEGGRGGSE